ncbi:DUF551 domain-containing protein [Acinetobacter baumannii]|uniref:DUF551 domain-containing protein n=2 Tax=Bacteria TaxID=2 RepID=UPI001FF29F77|nr:DUF551 domain-containing protein [Acinetobacter baumannii]MCJ9206309.1 DUF551 domain-containing protein [Acinetobacter baumannii]MCJ9331472.1 DUF551 domain-containing protein [Acinetobacter baumannii]MCJ9527913.1 DUF551 domain-containing protein [Acinetobacter baumannii]MCJ9531897.1 DUF551 domain-containing protein [Acinetobacter baumannii]
MTDLNKEREAFEKLSEIAEILNEEKSHFNGDFYDLPFNSCAESFINGAWYAWQEKAKAQAVPVWISVDDHMPESLRNVLVLLDANPAKNQNQMVAHFIPKFTEEYHGDDDWYDYDEDRGCGYVKEGWYANTAYIGDEYSSYFIEEKVTHWKSLKEASESGAEK